MTSQLSKIQTRELFIFGVFTALLLASPLGVHAALPEGFETEVILSGLNLPTDIVYTEDKSHAYIAEKSGVVRVAHDDVLLPDPAFRIDEGLRRAALTALSETTRDWIPTRVHAQSYKRY